MADANLEKQLQEVTESRDAYLRECGRLTVEMMRLAGEHRDLAFELVYAQRAREEARGVVRHLLSCFGPESEVRQAVEAKHEWARQVQ